MKTPEEIYNKVTNNGQRILKYHLFEKALKIYDTELKKQTDIITEFGKMDGIELGKKYVIKIIEDAIQSINTKDVT